MPRRPAQTMLLTLMVVAGILVGVGLTRRGRAERAGDLPGNAPPDVEIERATAADLVRHGFRLSGREPASWRDISLRLSRDGRGSITCLRCIIEADEVDGLLAWPPGSRRPVASRPPPDWPWGGTDDRLAVPAWWRPAGGRARCSERPSRDGDAAQGLFASYDPALRLLHLWQWSRAGWLPERPSPLSVPVADLVVLHLGRAGVATGDMGDGWRQVIALPWSALGLPAAGVTTVSAAFLPQERRHRYLLALHGLDEDQAWRLAAEQPQHPLPDDGTAPGARWAFALPPGGLPSWFAAGAGPRRHHALVRIGSGRVDAGRWLAYDRKARVLLVWDWADAEPRDHQADLTP